MFSTSNVAPLLEEEKNPLLDNVRNVHGTKMYKTYIQCHNFFKSILNSFLGENVRNKCTNA